MPRLSDNEKRGIKNRNDINSLQLIFHKYNLLVMNASYISTVAYRPGTFRNAEICIAAPGSSGEHIVLSWIEPQ